MSTPNPLTVAEVLAVLRQIESGAVTLPPHEREAAEASYSGVPVFHASNGWVFYVFNDCDEWDYLQRVESPDGRSLDFEDMPDELQEYQPPQSTARALWGLEP